MKQQWRKSNFQRLPPVRAAIDLSLPEIPQITIYKALNIDSASFTQMKNVCNKDVNLMEEMILDIVKTRGLMQNPVTGSGGMLIGRVLEVGLKFPDQSLQVGDKIATLVSLSLTPLVIDKIKSINLDNDQVHIDGTAILFESGIFARVPSDMDEHLVLAALDVAGAPAQVDKLVKEGDSVVIIGAAGKSGVLCAYQAMNKATSKGTVIGVVIALAGGFIVYGVMKKLVGIRLSQEEEYEGADLSIHKVSSEADE